MFFFYDVWLSQRKPKVMYSTLIWSSVLRLREKALNFLLDLFGLSCVLPLSPPQPTKKTSSARLLSRREVDHFCIFASLLNSEAN